MDDPLSAVDAKVAKQIFEKCLRPLSQEKTIVLATHQIGFLYECDEAIVIEDGRILAKGKPQEVKKNL